jgi:hypothetical protein
MDPSSLTGNSMSVSEGISSPLGLCLPKIITFSSPPAALRRIVREAIMHHVNKRALRLVRAEEKQERTDLERVVEQAI